MSDPDETAPENPDLTGQDSGRRHFLDDLPQWGASTSGPRLELPPSGLDDDGGNDGEDGAWSSFPWPSVLNTPRRRAVAGTGALITAVVVAALSLPSGGPSSEQEVDSRIRKVLGQTQPCDPLLQEEILRQALNRLTAAAEASDARASGAHQTPNDAPWKAAARVAECYIKSDFPFRPYRTEGEADEPGVHYEIYDWYVAYAQARPHDARVLMAKLRDGWQSRSLQVMQGAQAALVGDLTGAAAHFRDAANRPYVNADRLDLANALAQSISSAGRAIQEKRPGATFVGMRTLLELYMGFEHANVLETSPDLDPGLRNWYLWRTVQLGENDVSGKALRTTQELVEIGREMHSAELIIAACDQFLAVGELGRANVAYESARSMPKGGIYLYANFLYAKQLMKRATAPPSSSAVRQLSDKQRRSYWTTAQRVTDRDAKRGGLNSILDAADVAYRAARTYEGDARLAEAALVRLRAAERAFPATYDDPKAPVSPLNNSPLRLGMRCRMAIVLTEQGRYADAHAQLERYPWQLQDWTAARVEANLLLTEAVVDGRLNTQKLDAAKRVLRNSWWRKEGIDREIRIIDQFQAAKSPKEGHASWKEFSASVGAVTSSSSVSSLIRDVSCEPPAPAPSPVGVPAVYRAPAEGGVVARFVLAPTSTPGGPRYRATVKPVVAASPASEPTVGPPIQERHVGTKHRHRVARQVPQGRRLREARAAVRSATGVVGAGVVGAGAASTGAAGKTVAATRHSASTPATTPATTPAVAGGIGSSARLPGGSARQPSSVRTGRSTTSGLPDRAVQATGRPTGAPPRPVLGRQPPSVAMVRSYP